MENGQGSHGQPPNRNPRSTNLFPSLLNGQGGPVTNIWSNNLPTDGLASRDTAGVPGASKSWDANGAKLTQHTASGQSLHSGQRSNGVNASDSSRWPSGLAWTSSESVQSRPNATRSTSPPTAFQNTSNTSPSFKPGRSANGKSTTFPTSIAPASNSLMGYSSIAGGRNNSFQASFGSFQRGSQPTPGYDDAATSREVILPPSRHSESEAPPFGNDAFGFANGMTTQSRHASRPSLSAASSSYFPQPSNSRSQSLNPHDEMALEAARASFNRGMANGSPGPRLGGIQPSAPVSSQFSRGMELTPSNPLHSFSQEQRRESLASVNQSAMNSPRGFGGARPADAWATTPSRDLDQMSRVQRPQSQVSRLPNQSPYVDPQYNPAGFQPHLIQQIMHPGLSLPYPAYGLPGQPFFAPTAPAAFTSRPSRVPDPYAGCKATPQLLEDFKRSYKSNRKWQLKDVLGFVTDFAGDQQGSRFLQEKIPGANSDDKQKVFEEILVNAQEMMTDVFGNYIVQKLFEYGTLVQKKLLAAKMKGHVAELAMNIYGCRCVQEALQYVLVEQQVEIAMELEPEIIRLMQGVHSNHVVQKVLTKLPRERIDFIYDAVRGKVFTLSTEQYACRVIQRMIEQGTDADRAFILEEFHEVAHKLVTDDWGNYVVQAVIKQGGPDARARVIRLCIDHFLPFSKQKVASNVMEHCIEYGTDEDRLEIYRFITTQPTEDGTSMLQLMWKDQFANYVVQKLCFCLNGAEQEALIMDSRPYYLARKKPSRPDEKWAAFEKLMSRFSAATSRQGSISSVNGDLNGVAASRPSSLSDVNSAMPTPALTTGGNSPRTSSSQATSDGATETQAPLHEIINKFDEVGLGAKLSA
ncbi:hypothetical protein VP1G_01730 [Cytospora mali]|uniref:PUM-HD domain-containing protein n=1 Tax=Cytospora mali TaxID=578113 RepID=A0A194URX0_CYTMA|nr:hypothetical protein VP1G_01730 [Valsa mali var. pyri (nom. inval.)]